VLKKHKNFGQINYLLYEGAQLIGYLGLFEFQQTGYEMTGVIHPKFRRQGLFTRLFRQAIFDLNYRSVESCLVCCPTDSQAGIAFLKAHGGEYSYFETKMEYLAEKLPAIPLIDKAELTLATMDDLTRLTAVHALSFAREAEEVESRFKFGLDNPKRKAWLLTVDGKDVGKIHARWDKACVYLHDIGIIPEAQKKGYGSFMVLKTIKWLKSHGEDCVYLDIFDDNPAAMKLYSRCGFETVESYQFWKLSIEKAYQSLV
jgi:ribosomal protein S18 acetylase RimI-like enzyme